MKKFMRLLALTLAMAMMLSMVAMAADERDSPEPTDETVEDTTPADTPDAAEPETPTGEDAAVTPADPAEPTEDPADTPSEGDPGEEPGGGEDTDTPQLVMRWLDWDEEGRNFASEDTLNPEYSAEYDLVMNHTNNQSLIFFIEENGLKTPVKADDLTGGGSISVNPRDAEGIAPGAQESDCYVELVMNYFADGTVSTVYNGETLTFHVRAELPDIGVYSAPEATPENLLPNGYNPELLTDRTAYVITIPNDDYSITGVEKFPDDNEPYTIEPFGENIWKITITSTHDGIGINLKLVIEYSDGNVDNDSSYGTWFDYPQEPQLWIKWSWLDWNEETESNFIIQNDRYDEGFQPHPTEEPSMIFYTSDGRDEYHQPINPQPVLPEDLAASTGMKITSLADEAPGDELAPYLVKVEVDEWFKEYKITSGEHVMYVTSYLPDFGFYSKPEFDTDAYIGSGDWRFSPLQPTIYVGSYPQEWDADRYIADLKLVDTVEGISLKKVNDDFYALTREDINLANGERINFEITWGWPDGRTETDTSANIGTWNVETVIASTKPLPDLRKDGVSDTYESIKDQISTSITLEEGETETIYLGSIYYYDWDEPGTEEWYFRLALPESLIVPDGLTLTPDHSGGVPTKYTISGNTPGEYGIGLKLWYGEWYVQNTSGEFIDEELLSQNISPDYDFEKGEWFLYQYERNEDGTWNTTLIDPEDYDIAMDTLDIRFVDVDCTPLKVTVTKKPTPVDPVTPDTPIIPPYVFADTYRVDLASAFTGGKVVSNVSYAEAGENVTLTVQPDKGYELTSLSVTDARGRAVALTEVSANVYRFRMPALRVSVSAVFEKIVEDTTPAPAPAVDPTTAAAAAALVGTPGLSGITLNSAPMPFSDVRSSDWFYNDVDFMWKHYLMSGTSDYAFSPNATTSRAMIWTVLARMNGVRTDQYAGSVWYERGKQWSQERGLTDGTNPMGEVTREQLVTMLWRNAGQPASSAEISQFSDAGTVSGYAQAAVRWAVSTGLLTGSDGKLNPQGTATRAQIAALVSRYAAKAA